MKGTINLNNENIIFYEFDYSNLDFSSPLIQKNNKNEDVSTNTESNVSANTENPAIPTPEDFNDRY